MGIAGKWSWTSKHQLKYKISTIIFYFNNSNGQTSESFRDKTPPAGSPVRSMSP